MGARAIFGVSFLAMIALCLSCTVSEHVPDEQVRSVATLPFKDISKPLYPSTPMPTKQSAPGVSSHTHRARRLLESTPLRTSNLGGPNRISTLPESMFLRSFHARPSSGLHESQSRRIPSEPVLNTRAIPWTGSRTFGTPPLEESMSPSGAEDTARYLNGVLFSRIGLSSMGNTIEDLTSSVSKNVLRPLDSARRFQVGDTKVKITGNVSSDLDRAFVAVDIRF